MRGNWLPGASVELLPTWLGNPSEKEQTLDAAEIHNLSLADKRKLLAELLRRKLKQEASYPISRGQRGLWFLAQLDSAEVSCNIHFASTIHSPLNVAAFERTLQSLWDRHPSLRTTFHEQRGEILQTIHDDMPLALQWVHAESWSESELRKRLDEEIHRPFELQTGPLFRAYVFKRSEVEHIFLATSHHLVLDFWSVMILWKDALHGYPRECAQPRLPQAPPTTKRYPDFVQWQDELLRSGRARELEAFWMRTLQGVPPAFEFPSDFARPARFSHTAGNVPCHIPEHLTRRLLALATQEKVTLYATLLAALQVLLGRHSGDEDFLIGSPFSGRSHPSFRDVVGCFINLIPMRARLSAELTFRQLLRQVSESVWASLQHQDYPFSLMVESLGIKHDLSRHPLVQVSFTLEQSQFGEEPNSKGFLFAGEDKQTRPMGSPNSLQQSPLYLEQRTCQMDLEWVLERDGKELSGILRYCTSLYRRELAERLVERFQTLLADVVRFPDRPIGKLQWYSDSERRLVVEEWNRTNVEFPRDVCLHHLFERQAERRPAATVLRCPNRTYSYQLIEQAANQWAHRLRDLGVGPGSRIGLCFDASAELVVAILATLKAGGAYVPLDPRAPWERQRRVLDDASLALTLASPRFLSQFPPQFGQVVEVPPLNDDEVFASPDPGPPPSGAKPTDVAYLIYTSGSTGQPKGVLVEHRSICNTVLWRQKEIPLDSSDRSLWLVPAFFDPSVALLFQNFAAGAQLVIPAPGEELHPPRLIDRIRAHAVTAVTASPRLLSLILNETAASECGTIRHVHCGGESPSTELPRQILRCWGATLTNLYGPTETAVEATWWRCDPDSQEETIPIGRPIANMRAYVMDQLQNPLPVGVPGEIYLAGDGLARGYLHDPELTADRFISGPIHDVQERRLYRTGDRGRWLPSGSLEFLGRVDEQIKLRGYRIEPGEVESALASHPAIQESVVVVHERESSAPQLVAFVIIDVTSTAPNTTELQRYVRERLPEYMVPDSIQIIDAFPRSPSGKVDRRRLETIALQRSDRGSIRTPPQTPLEIFLASVWCDLLHLEAMGREDNFYELGGTSLQGAMFVSRLQQELNQRLPLITVFELPTIVDLARFLGNAFPDEIANRFGTESLPKSLEEAGQPQGYPMESVPEGMELPEHRRVNPELIVPLRATGSRTPLFLVHPPGGIVVCYQPLAHGLAADHPVYGIRARGLYPGEQLHSRLESMAADYCHALRGIQQQGPYLLAGWSLGGVVALEIAQQLLAAGERVDLLAFLDTTIPHGEANRAYNTETESSGLEYGFDITLEELAELPSEQQLPFLWRHVERLGLIDSSAPEDVIQQILEDLKRVFHNHVQLASEYVVRPYPGKITLFRPDDSPVDVVTRRDRGWGQLAAEVEVHTVPGQHHTMVKPPHVSRLAEVLAECLAKTEPLSLR